MPPKCLKARARPNCLTGASRKRRSITCDLAQLFLPKSIPRHECPSHEVTGRKHHILVDTLGLLLKVVVHPADVQDRDGARLVVDRRTRCLFSFIERIFADAGYQGPRAARVAASTGRWVSRSSSAMNCINSASCQSAGSSNAPWPGSAAIAAWHA